jgi:hypothetical protein
VPYRRLIGQRKLTDLYRHTLFPYLHRLFELALPDCLELYHACLIYGPSNIIMLPYCINCSNWDKMACTVNVQVWSRI